MKSLRKLINASAEIAMWLIDFILNLAGLLLWLKWTQTRSPQLEFPGISLVGTLRRASAPSPKSAVFLVIVGLLALRAVLYWQLGSALSWTPRLSLGVISLPFRSDHFWRIFSYSFLSFGLTLGSFYLALLFLSILNGPRMDNDPIQRLINEQLGWVSSLPTALKCLLPVFVVFVLWLAVSFLFEAMRLIPQVQSFAHRMEQGIVIGVAVFSAWKFVVMALMLLYLLNSYVYFGTSPIWGFIDFSGRRLLTLVRWLPLRLGRFDFAPIVLAALVALVVEVCVNGFSYRFGNTERGIQGLVDLYRSLPL